MVNKALSLEYGLAGICVLLTTLVLMKVAEFLWKLHQKKEQVSEETMKALVREVHESTVTMRLLEQRLRSLENSFAEIPKLKLDLRRSFTAIKTLAGPKWAAIRDELMKDGLAQ